MEGASTSTGAFVGVAEKGIVGKAYLITSFNQFVNTFGSYMNDSYLAYAVRHFFQNGGSRCYVTRTCHYTDGRPDAVKATGEIMEGATEPATAITVNATSEGTWGNGIEFNVTQVNDVDNDEFEVEITLDDEIERITGEDIEELEAEINSRSNLVNVIIVSSDFDATATVTLADGEDGLDQIGATDYVGDSATGNGLYSFDEFNVNIVAVPGITAEQTQVGLKDYCMQREDCFGILATPKSTTPQEAVTYKQENNIESDLTALYYPWVEVSDPIGRGKNPTKWLPPTGAIAGIYARTDATRGVFKAPAGYGTNLVGVLDVEYDVSDGEQDILNPARVNAIRSFDNAGIVVWGARTLSSNPEYKYVNTSRTVLYIRNSLLNSMGWAVFENNDEGLWGKIRASASDFLRNLWREGGLKGTNEDEAFFVKCDGELNTDEVIDAGKLYCDIGISDQKPAEFIVFRLSLI